MHNIIEYKKFLNITFCIALTIAFISQLSLAQEPDLTDDDFYSDIPMVLTVSRLEQPKKESPSSVTIIDQAMIKAAGIRELSSVLNLVPGFLVGHVEGNKAVVTYQGLGYDFNRQLQVLIDGRSVFIPSFGGIPWESLPVSLEDIEIIEVTRGPNAASYGSNSFLAVINIITREPYQAKGPYVSISHSNDHKKISDAYFSYSQQLEQFDWSVSLKTQADDGFEFLSEKTPNNDSKKINKFNLRGNFLINPDSQLSFQIGQSSGKLSRGDGGNADIFRKEKTVNRFQSIAYEHSGSHSSTSIKLFHTEHTVDDAFDIIFEIFPGFSTPATVSFDRYSERTELEIEKTINLNNEHRVVFGGSFRKDTVDSFFLLGEEQKKGLDVKRLFAQSEYKFNDDKILNLGAMVEEYNDSDLTVSPRIAYIQHLNQKHSLRLSYSKAFRNPILFEMFGRSAFALNDLPPAFSTLNPIENNAPNPNIKPEEIKSFEISLNSRFTKNFETDLKLYRYNISNQITDINISSSLNQFQNRSAGTRAKGIELALSYKPSNHFFIKSGINVILTDGFDDDTEQSFPNKTLFVLSQYDINQHHSISGNFRYIADFNWISSSDDFLGSSKKLDLRYAYHFNLDHDTPMTLELIGQNLLSDYLDYSDTNIQTKSFFLKLSNRF